MVGQPCRTDRKGQWHKEKLSESRHCAIKAALKTFEANLSKGSNGLSLATMLHRHLQGEQISLFRALYARSDTHTKLGQGTASFQKPCLQFWGRVGLYSYAQGSEGARRGTGLTEGYRVILSVGGRPLENQWVNIPFRAVGRDQGQRPRAKGPRMRPTLVLCVVMFDM